jgi:hypothetical protein
VYFFICQEAPNIKLFFLFADDSVLLIKAKRQGGHNNVCQILTQCTISAKDFTTDSRYAQSMDMDIKKKKLSAKLT